MVIRIDLKGECSVFKKIIMDENNALAKYNKIPLGHNRPMAPFTPKSTSTLRSALHIGYSLVIPRFISRANTAQS